MGIGIDIIEVDRVRSVCDRHGEVFYDRVFTSREQDYCLSFKADAWRRFAGRFAAKEAIAKALGCGIGKTLGWLDIDVSSAESGAPVATLSDRAKETFGDVTLNVSITHSRDYAAAVATTTEHS